MAETARISDTGGFAVLFPDRYAMIDAIGVRAGQGIHW
jgi:hypothetical protein